MVTLLNNIVLKKIYEFLKKKISKDHYEFNKNSLFEYLTKKYAFNKNDLLVQLLPTGPLRSIETIKKAINLARKTKKDVFSVNQFDFHLSFAMQVLKRNKWRSVFENSPLETGNTRSQNQKIFYRPNPLINCLWIKNIKKNRKSIYKNALAIQTDKLESLNIDNLDDFNLVNSIAKNFYKKN